MGFGPFPDNGKWLGACALRVEIWRNGLLLESPFW
ncbi:hypothetical protein PCO31010_02998 [Pandoraea commovens]|uniref:Uncharacterized protein n=1 Tax=Pandoraea commovens TaxID=2508289 RepID=A0A5E4W2P0_9BURK|nr:hypothetical protein PCO31010_02998 [Pandoraea commovens]